MRYSEIEILFLIHHCYWVLTRYETFIIVKFKLNHQFKVNKYIRIFIGEIYNCLNICSKTYLLIKILQNIHIYL